MMKKTKIGAAVLMAAFAMMTVQPMTSMAAGNCQTWICGGNGTNICGTVLGGCGINNAMFGNCESQCFGQSGCQTENSCKPGSWFQNTTSCGSRAKNWNTGFGNWSAGCRK